MSNIRCSIVTPAEQLFDGEIKYASVPAWDGQLGVMSGQSPVLSRVDAGVLRLDSPDGKRHHFFVDGGFAQVQDDVLTLISQGAAAAESLSLEEAEAELAEANARVAQDGEDYERVCADQRRARAKIAAIRAVK